jgi:hypothetical protein
MWHCFIDRTHCLIHLQRSCVPPTCKLCMPWLCFKTQSLEEGSSPRPVAWAFCGGKLPVKCKGESSDSELRHGIFCDRMWIRNLHQKVSSAIECESGIWLDRYLLQQNITQESEWKVCCHKTAQFASLPLYEVRKAQELTVLDLVPDRNHLLLLLWSSVHEEKGIIFIIIRSWSETCWIIWLQCPCIRIVLVKLHFDIIPFESLALKILLMFLFSFSFFIFLLQHGSYKYFANSQNLSADEPH